MDPKEQVRRQYRALITGDAALAVASTPPDWVNVEARDEPPACSVPGPAGLLATGAWLRSAFSELAVEEEVSVADGDWVVSTIVLSGRHTGPFTSFEGGAVAQVVPPTGRVFAVRQTHLHRVRGTEIVEHSAVRDDLGLLTQLGLFPPRPSVGMRMLAWKLSGRAARAGRAAAAAAEAAAAQVASDRPVPVG
jgi:ketosteroid isomerase-like protein